MRQDHRPYRLKQAVRRFEAWYARRILAPQFDALGKNPLFMRPWYVSVFGPSIFIGDFVNIIAAPDMRVRLSVWPLEQGSGEIRIGHRCLICPGVRISAAAGIRIGDDTMLASRVYITDADWHDPYNRIDPGRPEKIAVGKNVWIGDNAIVCKGVSIGDHAIIGAGSVVASDVPPMAVAAGNPARVVKTLDPDAPMTTRETFFSRPDDLFAEVEAMDRYMMGGNSLFCWLRTLVAPRRDD